MKYLLDTCVLSELTRKRPETKVVDWLQRQDELRLYLSVITLGELHKGIARLPVSRKKPDLERWVEQDLADRFVGRVLDIDVEVAERWGRLSAEAELAGRPLPVVDALLASTALVRGLTLVTRNTPDFERTGVALVDPWVPPE